MCMMIGYMLFYNARDQRCLLYSFLKVFHDFLSQTLTVLSLHTNKIGDSGAEKLAEGLKTNNVSYFSRCQACYQNRIQTLALEYVEFLSFAINQTASCKIAVVSNSFTQQICLYLLFTAAYLSCKYIEIQLIGVLSLS